MNENTKAIGFTNKNILDIFKSISFFLDELDKNWSSFKELKDENIKVSMPNYVIKLLKGFEELGDENLNYKHNKLYIYDYEIVINYSDSIVIFKADNMIYEDAKSRFFFSIEMKDIFKENDNIENNLYLKKESYKRNF